jgi:hypothetical protein
MKRRVPIQFDKVYGWLSSALLLPPSASYLEVDDREVHVRMAWAFRARFPRNAVVSAERSDRRPLSRGVHGFAGRWLVNGSGDGIVVINLNPDQRAYVMGFPVRLRQLLVSVSDPVGLALAFGASR